MPNRISEIKKGLWNYLSRIYSTNIEIKNIINITSGWETEVYSFELTYSLNVQHIDRPLILRIYSGHNAAEAALVEYDTLQKLSKCNYPVPKVFFSETNIKFIGNPFIIMERINGQPLWTVMDQHTGTELTSLIQIFCQLFIQLHKIDWTKLISQKYEPENRLKEIIQFYHNSIISNKKTDLLRITTWLKDQLPTLSNHCLAINHGDFHPNNILITAEGPAYVIDWHELAVMDHRIDIGWCLLLTSSTNDGRSDKLDELILSKYNELWGKPLTNILFFEVMAILRRLLDFYVSMSQGTRKQGMREDTIQIIQAQKTHFKTVYDKLGILTGITLPSIESILQSL